MQRHLARTHGRRWVVLPHTYGFVDPLFSTGIAWSLAGVERLADVLCTLGPEAGEIATGGAFDRYAGLLVAELRQIDRLVYGAYRARHDFELFAAQAMLYFAAVSYEESRQRLCDLPSPWWRGFLGANHPTMESIFTKARERLDRVGRDHAPDGAGFTAWVREKIEPWNVAGLLDPQRENLYPVDFSDLIAGADKLGLTAEAVRAAVPRLRGGQAGQLLPSHSSRSSA